MSIIVAIGHKFRATLSLLFTQKMILKIAIGTDIKRKIMLIKTKVLNSLFIIN